MTYDITHKDEDYILCKLVVEDINDCKTKIQNELQSMGVLKKKSKARDDTRDKLCFFGLKYKQPAADEECDESNCYSAALV